MENKTKTSNKYVNVTSKGIPKAEAVEPIRNLKDIEKIKRYLKGKDNKRDYALFVVGINIGLRASDLLKIKIGDVSNGVVTIFEKKTGKKRDFKFNDSCMDAINLYLETLDGYSPDDYLFESRKNSGCLTVNSAHKIIKSTLRELNIPGNYGTHTLRKTFCYQSYMKNYAKNPAILAILQEILNHTSQAITLRYMGITKDVMLDVYTSLNL